MNLQEKYELVVGLEVHAQLLTKSKAYSTEINNYGDLPNTNISLLTLAHPGTLPRANHTTFDYAIKLGIAVGSQITPYTYFARKNYFYPDLPKGYQITQDKTPLCKGGKILITLKDDARTEKEINITRIHVEEDAGKSIHIDGTEESFIDLNRAGVPLIEIVSEPDIRHSEEAYWYLHEVRKLLRYLEICDGNMEEGSMRCDVNVSVRVKGQEKFGTRVEIKNLNSFSNVKRAIEYEFIRQTELIENQRKVEPETRTFDATLGQTFALRSKETLNDYRYFPEPDLTPILVNEAWLERVRATMPPLPRAFYLKFVQQYQLTAYDAEQLTLEKPLALYFEEICQHVNNKKAAANWVLGSVKAYLNELMLPIESFPLNSEAIASLINLIEEGKINHNLAKQVFQKMLEHPGKTALQIAEENQLIVESNTDEILRIIEKVVAQYPDKVSEYKQGKKGLQGMFMGEIMKITKGKADPQLTNKLLQEVLEK